MADEEGGGSKQGCCQKFCHLEYFRTFQGLGKCLELLVVLLGLILMSTVSAVNATSIKFFIFVHTTGMIFIIIHIFLNIIGVFHKLPLIVIGNLTYMVLCAVAALVFLICSSITLNKYGEDIVKAASVFGLIAMGLFIAETFYHFVMYRKGGNIQRTEMKETSNAATTEQEQPPNY